MPFLQDHLPYLVATYGYYLVGTIIALESMGVPLPGESVLVLAAIYAGTTQRLDISAVIAVAAAGAILGDNLGFWLGRWIGFPMALRHGYRIGLTTGRLKLGQYLFLRHGGKVVFFGRFVAVLRVLAAFLAGTNRMPFARFFLFNASGGVVWAFVFGGGAYLLGDQIQRLSGLIAAVMLAAFAVIVVAATLFLNHHEARLVLEAELALPDPLDTKPTLPLFR
ncbi:MAG: DedA family protein [Rhodospirillaceae bacterium]